MWPNLKKNNIELKQLCHKRFGNHFRQINYLEYYFYHSKKYYSPTYCTKKSPNSTMVNDFILKMYHINLVPGQ